MKVLVLGASGMAGHVVSSYLERSHDVTRVAGTRKTTPDTILLNLADTTALNNYFFENSFDVIVNCAGMLVAQSEREKDYAVYLNAFLPLHLEALHWSTKIIHLSTDCVFSGENGPYTEDSPYDGKLFYDRTKQLGEINNDKDLTFRMSIIGPELKSNGSGLFNWFTQQTGEVTGYSNVIWNGITTIELAKAISSAIWQDLTGLYHLTPSESISKYDLLKLIQEYYPEIKADVSPKEVTPSNKTLINSRWDFEYTVPKYKKMISEMREWTDKYSYLYGENI